MYVCIDTCLVIVASLKCAFLYILFKCFFCFFKSSPSCYRVFVSYPSFTFLSFLHHSFEVYPGNTLVVVVVVRRRRVKMLHWGLPSFLPFFLPSFVPFLFSISFSFACWCHFWIPFNTCILLPHPVSASHLLHCGKLTLTFPLPLFFFLLLFSILLHNFSLPSYFFSNLLAFIPPPGVAALVLCFPDEFLFLFNHFSLTGFTRTLPWSSWSSWSVWNVLSHADNVTSALSSQPQLRLGPGWLFYFFFSMLVKRREEKRSKKMCWD